MQKYKIELFIIIICFWKCKYWLFYQENVTGTWIYIWFKKHIFHVRTQSLTSEMCVRCKYKFHLTV